MILLVEQLTVDDNLTVGGALGVTMEMLLVGGGNLTVTGAGTSVTAVKYYGDGSALTGIDQTALVDGNGTTRVQAHTDGADITGSLSLSYYLRCIWNLYFHWCNYSIWWCSW